jgi:hypothetical protein
MTCSVPALAMIPLLQAVTSPDPMLALSPPLNEPAPSLVKHIPIPYGDMPVDGQPTSVTSITKPGVSMKGPHMMLELNFLGKLAQAALVEDDNWSDKDDDDNQSEFEACISEDANHEDANDSFQESNDPGHRKDSQLKHP